MSAISEEDRVDIAFSGLTYCVKTGKKKGFKTILKSASGNFCSGQLAAILGPSGAGKTTLMNILAGYRTSFVSGVKLFNGRERNCKWLRMRCCYIMQEDHLLPFLTVEESMEGAATLKLGNKVSKLDRNNVISDILETLNLEDSRQTRVANLSGGERKRLSIALELVTNPPVMFFDEPTSGLDSQNSYHCINLLKGLAVGGRTIICTIHQPSARIFEKFDTLYALAEGQCIYRGPIIGLIPFLSSLNLECPSYHNPADYLVEVVSGEYGSFIPQLVGAVNAKCNGKEVKAKNKGSVGNDPLDLLLNENESNFTADQIEVVISTDKEDLSDFGYPASFCTQFAVLFKRTFLSITRDMMLTKLRFAAHFVVGLFIGLVYYNVGNDASKVLSNIGFLFFSILFLLFTAMMPTILTFPLEINVFIREHLNHWYSLKAYYLAKTMADVPFQILFPLCYIIIAYFLTSQPLDVVRFSLFASLCIVTSLVAQSIGLAIGAAMNIQQAVFFGPVMSIPTLLFSGFFVTYSSIPVYLRWLTYLSYIRYSYEGSLLSIYGMDRKTLDCNEAFCAFKYPQKILETSDIKEGFLLVDFLALAIYFVLMRSLGYFILRWKLRQER